ncbi:MAG: twin-arginine translocation signal domain-containing protein [Anaerolineae bacterium]|nr:twin-arginine translocation signal domain-containing protein [Anaerolineae bacterium]MDW8068424.1 twin-arginine translocation signal domain-containing protein [Anaerolineae bacterium]
MQRDPRMEQVRRTARIARIIERLQRLDDGTLEALDRMTADALVGMTGGARPTAMSRRQFLGAAAAGGAVVALTSGLALWQMSAAHAAALEKEIASLRQILALYQELEALGLDDQVKRGANAVASLLEGVRDLAARLLEAMKGVRKALLDFQSRFPSLQSGLRWLRDALLVLSQRLTALENGINEAMGLSSPVQETVGGFLANILDRLPVPFAREVRGGLERMGEVVSLLPTLTQGIYTRVLEPLDDWFSQRADAGLNGWIVNPLLHTVLDPAQMLAERVLELATTWEEQLAAPTRQTIVRREQIRAEIARLLAEVQPPPG